MFTITNEKKFTIDAAAGTFQRISCWDFRIVGIRSLSVSLPFAFSALAQFYQLLV